MMPMSIGCIKDVVMGGRNSIWIFFKKSKFECAAQLSRSNNTFLDWRCSSVSQSFTHSLKSVELIHAFLFARYTTGKLSILSPLKQRGLAYFPITSNFLLSVPDMFEQHKTVTRSIAFLQPKRVTCL
ncbi:unnamed protein product [Dicrocoelium dendriticum]|nr:unnamed protein product [Dicrocoelium dendriticum]